MSYVKHVRDRSSVATTMSSQHESTKVLQKQGQTTIRTTKQKVQVQEWGHAKPVRRLKHNDYITLLTFGLEWVESHRGQTRRTFQDTFLQQSKQTLSCSTGPPTCCWEVPLRFLWSSWGHFSFTPLGSGASWDMPSEKPLQFWPYKQWFHQLPEILLTTEMNSRCQQTVAEEANSRKPLGKIITDKEIRFVCSTYWTENITHLGLSFFCLTTFLLSLFHLIQFIVC